MISNELITTNKVAEPWLLDNFDRLKIMSCKPYYGTGIEHKVFTNGEAFNELPLYVGECRFDNNQI